MILIKRNHPIESFYVIFHPADRYVVRKVGRWGGELFTELMSMLSISDKLAQLEDATAAAQSILSRKESELTYASEALSKAKSKLRSLNSEAQQTLHVNDTELPELISAELHAREEYNAAKARYEMNAKYLKLFREKMLREEKSSDR